MHVVIVTHYFPPIGGPGARRMLGWVNGFLAAGRRVTVVTPEAHPRDPYYQPEERYTGAAKVVAPKVHDPARLARGGSDDQPAAASSTTEKRGVAARLRPWLLLPDHRRLANGPLTRSAREAFRPGEPTLLLTSSPYNSVHLAGRRLKRFVGSELTWVADFRDDWFHPVFFPFPNAAYRAYNRCLERGVLRDADGLTVVSPKTLAKIESRHTEHFDDAFWRTDAGAKWKWMPNGFDATGVEDLLDEPVAPRNAGEPACLHFSGTLWQGHSVSALVRALDAVAERKGVRFQFELAGRVIEPLPTSPNPERVQIVTAGWKPYRESLAATRHADLLLVHTGPESQDIKIKVFDAAAVRRPVLVLGPADSATVRLVREHIDDPLVADQEDQQAIEAALERYLDSSDAASHGFTEVPEQFDRLKQARLLLDWAATLGQS